MQAKKINAELLDKLGDIKTLREEDLEQRLRHVEDSLPGLSRDFARRILNLFVTNRQSSAELSKAAIHRQMERTAADADHVEETLRTLEQQQLVFRNRAGNFELAGNVLNQHLYEKTEAEHLVLRKIHTFIKGQHQTYQERRQLLTEDDLNYIEPYEDELPLTDTEKKFIEKSKKNHRRKKILTGLLIGIVITLLTVMAAISFLNYHKAKDKAEEAEREKSRALLAQQEADELRQIAELNFEAAKQAESVALQKQEEAEWQQSIAERQKWVAEQLRRQDFRRAEENHLLRLNAEANATAADRLRREAEESAKKAQKSERRAQAEKDAAQQLRNIALSRQLAVKVTQMDSDKPTLKALLAREAYNFNYGKKEGNIHHPDIVKALYEGFAALQGTADFNSFNSAHGMVRDIIFDPDTEYLFTTGSSGVIKMWHINKYLPVQKPDIAEVASFEVEDVLNVLALSPGAKYLAAGGRHRVVYLFEIEKWASNPDYRPQELNLHRDNEVLQLVFLNDGKGLISSGTDLNLVYFNIKTGEKEVLVTSNQPITAIAMYADEPVFVFGTAAGEIRSYILPDRKSSRMYKTNSGVTALAVKGSMADSYILAGFENGEIWTRDNYLVLGRAYPEKTLRFHNARISDFEFINKNYFAAVSYDGRASLWNLQDMYRANYQPMYFDDMKGWGAALAYIPQSRQLLIGTQSGAVKTWQTDPKIYANAICQILQKQGRQITADEINLYIGADAYKNINRAKACD